MSAGAVITVWRCPICHGIDPNTGQSARACGRTRSCVTTKKRGGIVELTRMERVEFVAVDALTSEDAIEAGKEAMARETWGTPVRREADPGAPDPEAADPPRARPRACVGPAGVGAVLRWPVRLVGSSWAA